jgi:hypothetical protein
MGQPSRMETNGDDVLGRKSYILDMPDQTYSVGEAKRTLWLNDPSTAKSGARDTSIVSYGGCPVIWASKLYRYRRMWCCQAQNRNLWDCQQNLFASSASSYEDELAQRGDHAVIWHPAQPASPRQHQPSIAKTLRGQRWSDPARQGAENAPENSPHASIKSTITFVSG